MYAFNKGGNSDYSNIARDTTILLAPTELNAFCADGIVSLSWKDNSNNENGYIIERKVNNGIMDFLNKVEESNVEIYLDSNAAIGNTCYYCIKAYNAITSSDHSNEVSVTIVGVMEIISEMPKSFSLNQNYPNPFNPSTTLKYEIPKESYANLKVYDILGREVITLVKEQQKTGYYEVDWNAANNSSGIYFYKIMAGDFVDVKKMILMK